MNQEIEACQESDRVGYLSVVVWVAGRGTCDCPDRPLPFTRAQFECNHAPGDAWLCVSRPSDPRDRIPWAVFMPWTLTEEDLDSEEARAGAESIMAEEDKRILDLINSGGMFEGSMSSSSAPEGFMAQEDARRLAQFRALAEEPRIDRKMHVFLIQGQGLAAQCMGEDCRFCEAGLPVKSFRGGLSGTPFRDASPTSDEFTRSIKDQIKKLTDSIPKPVEKPVKSLFGLFAMATAFGVDVPRELDRAFGKPDHRDPSVERKPGAKANAEAKRAMRSAKRRGGA